MKRILIIEDDKDNLIEAEKFKNDSLYDVLISKSFDKTVPIIREKEFDLVITDMVFPVNTVSATSDNEIEVSNHSGLCILLLCTTIKKIPCIVFSDKHHHSSDQLTNWMNDIFYRRPIGKDVFIPNDTKMFNFPGFKFLLNGEHVLKQDLPKDQINEFFGGGSCKIKFIKDYFVFLKFLKEEYGFSI